MGVYIPKKKMPTSCYMCWDSLYCEYKIKNPVKMAQGRADECPLQPIDDEQVEKTQSELVKARTVFKSVFKDEKL